MYSNTQFWGNFKTIYQSKLRLKRIDWWRSYTGAFKIAHAICRFNLSILSSKVCTLTLKMEHRMQSSVCHYVCLRKAVWRQKRGSERGGENAKSPAIPFPDILIHFLSRFSVFWHALAQLNAFKASCLSLLFITTRLEPGHISSLSSRADNGKGKWKKKRG